MTGVHEFQIRVEAAAGAGLAGLGIVLRLFHWEAYLLYGIYESRNDWQSAVPSDGTIRTWAVDPFGLKSTSTAGKVNNVNNLVRTKERCILKLEPGSRSKGTRNPGTLIWRGRMEQACAIMVLVQDRCKTASMS